MQIKKLEEDLGIPLLERTHKAVFLTETGTAIVGRARYILNQVKEIREIAKLSKDPYAGEIKLGIFPTLAPYLLPIIIPALSSIYPKLSFYLVEEQTALIIEKLKLGVLDAVFLAAPIIEKSFNSAELFEEEFLLATPKTHPLAKQKHVKQHDLDHQNLLLLEEGHCMRAQTLALCQKMNASETQNFRATSLETLRQMVVAGVGITLLPKLACNASDSLCYVPFSEPKPARTIGLFWRTSTAKQVLIENMVNHIKVIMKKQNGIVVIK
jgi:LysR family transcriptional regulator, hydrogen peroxide-inducible genes activator